jgi:hypothetical protein
MDEPAPRFMETSEVGEAKVTFVKREPRAPLLPAVDMPADLGTERSSPLFQRLRQLKDTDEPAADANEPTEPFAAPPGPAEEAEVTIVKPGGGKSLPPMGQGRSVRRFLKALQGDD